MNVTRESLRRIAAPLAVAATLIVSVTACSGSSSSKDGVAAVVATSGASAASGAAASAGAASAGAASAGADGAGTSSGGTARPGHESHATVGADRDLTKLNPVAAATYQFRPGTQGTKNRFAAAAQTLNGIEAKAQYLRAVQRSSAVADVVVYTFDPAQTGSAVFRGQILNQLVGAASKSTKIRIETTAGRAFAIAGKKSAVVGAFDGSRAVIVVGRSGVGSLTAARSATYAYLDQ
jgi:hypothetical protein